nr:hypothetical protein [Candidatus Cloacimonadota bacterium]
MKTCIITNSHPSNDVRLYYKLGTSLTALGEVYIISTNGIVNHHTNPYQIIVSAGSSLKALPLIYKECKAIAPDLVICVEPLTVPLALLLRRSIGCKVIFDVHEFFAEAHSERVHWLFRPFVRQIYLSFERFLAHRADAVTAVNQEIINQLFPANPNAKNLLVMPNYPVKNVWDYQCDIPGSLSRLCAMRFDLIYVGGITRDRGIFKILKSATLLKNEFPHLKILILGKFHDPNIESQFIESIDNFNLNAVIYYQEWIPPEKIGLLLKRSRYGLWLFNPKNKRMRMAIPLKVLEYLAAGLPVISIKTPLMQSVIGANKLGELSSYRARDIAASIAKMLRLPQKEYEELSARCAHIAQTRFNWESLEEKYFALIKSLI